MLTCEASTEPTGGPRNAAAPLSSRSQIRVAYLLSRYPAVSHTFFLHEVLGLRARGMRIATISVNPPDRALADLPPEEAAEARTTEYLQGSSKARAVLTILLTALAHPVVLARGLVFVARLPGLTLARRAFWLFYLAEALLVGRLMRARALDHLHIHFGGAVASVGMLAAAAWGVTYSLTIHGPEELQNVDTYSLREKVQGASFVFCISDFCRSQLYQLTPPETWGKFSVLRLGVDPVVLAPNSRRQASAGERLELVCTGRLVAAKGHRVLLDALRRLEERGVRLHTTLIGDGPERPGLGAYISRHGLGEAVTLAGALAHPSTLAHLRRAEIFVLASFSEGIPVAIMEAMSLGLPAVSTTIAGIPELVEHGVDGLLVPPANVEALADALERLAADTGLRRSLGSAARQKIIARYNLPLNQELLVDCFAAELERLAERLSNTRKDNR